MNERYTQRGAFARANQQGDIEILASSESLAADGLIVEAQAWDVTRFLAAGAPICWAHDLAGHRPPIGKAHNVRVTKRGLEMAVEFDDHDDFAKLIRDKVERGFVSCVSVSFDVLEKVGNRVKKAILVETSFVPVGADPLAVVTSRALANGTATTDALETTLLDAYANKAIVSELLAGLRQRHAEYAEIESRLGPEVCDKLARRALGGFRQSETQHWDWGIFEPRKGYRA